MSVDTSQLWIGILKISKHSSFLRVFLIPNTGLRSRSKLFLFFWDHVKLCNFFIPTIFFYHSQLEITILKIFNIFPSQLVCKISTQSLRYLAFERTLGKTIPLFSWRWMNWRNLLSSNTSNWKDSHRNK